MAYHEDTKTPSFFLRALVPLWLGFYSYGCHRIFYDVAATGASSRNCE
jgi:hypothetical protein